MFALSCAVLQSVFKNSHQCYFFDRIRLLRVKAVHTMLILSAKACNLSIYGAKLSFVDHLRRSNLLTRLRPETIKKNETNLSCYCTLKKNVKLFLQTKASRLFFRSLVEDPYLHACFVCKGAETTD